MSTNANLTKLLSKIEVDDAECWNWKSSRDQDGYGLFRDINLKRSRAHRASYELHIGPIPSKDCVLHRCDNPACVNPSHLFLGTNKDNIADKVAKGRQAKGASHGRAKLSPKQVLAIHAARGVSLSKIAKQYGVHPAQVARIRSGKRWPELTGGPTSRLLP